MRLQGLREATRRRIGTPSGDRLLDAQAIDEAVNFAVDCFESEYRWPWLEQMTELILLPGTRTIELPATWRSTSSVLPWDGMRSCWGDDLANMAAVDVLRDRSTPHNPDRFAVYGRHLIFGPIPSSEVKLLHLWTGSSPYLSRDDDEPLVPDEFSSILVAAASGQMHHREGDYRGEAADVAEYANGVQRARLSLRPHKGPSVPRVRPGAWVAW